MTPKSFTCPTCLSQCEPDRIACDDVVGNCPARAIVAAMMLEPIVSQRPNPDIQPRPQFMRDREARAGAPLGGYLDARGIGVGDGGNQVVAAYSMLDEKREPACVKDHKGRRFLALTEAEAIAMRHEYLLTEGTLAAFTAWELGRNTLPPHPPEPRVRWSQRFITQPAALIAIELVAVAIVLWFVGELIVARLS